jgi:hypothetical protein
MNKNLKSCVYYFFNETDYKEKKNKNRHKIATLDWFIKNELTNILKIKNCVNYKSMFYIWEKNDPLRIAKYTDSFDYIEYGIDNTILLKYEDLEFISLKNYLKALNSSKKYIYSVIYFYKNLLVSLQMLLEKQIVHTNICFDNILINKSMENPLITSFTFSINLSSTDVDSQLRQIFISYDPSYYQWPPEFHLLSYLYINKLESLSLINIESIINDIISNHELLNIFGDSIVSIYREESIKYFSKYVNKNYKFIYNDIFQFSHTWDNYTLSIMFLKILIFLHRSLNKQNKFIILFMKLLVDNINLNPEKRVSIVATTNKFEKILDSLDITDYLNLTQNLVFS